MISEPMLAVKPKKGQALTFPLMASVKLDGVRALVIGGKVVSRTFKLIPNAWVQRTFGRLPEGTDGELIFGDPTHIDAYRNTVSAVMSEDGEPTAVSYHVFDNFEVSGGFRERFQHVRNSKQYHQANVQIVPHSIIESAAQLDQVEEIAVNAGYEGLMTRKMNGPYKEGRSTANEEYLLKIKRFEDAEAVILDAFEWETNTNSAMTSATGHTERSSHKAGMVGANTLGGFDVRGLNGKYEGIEYSVGSGFKGAANEWIPDADGNPTNVHTERWLLWHNRKALIGKVIKVKYFPTGSKDKPRFPVFLGFRDPMDFEEKK